MNILALDTSTPSTAVGLMLDGRQALEGYDHPDAGERPATRRGCCRSPAELLDQAGVDWRDDRSRRGRARARAPTRACAWASRAHARSRSRSTLEIVGRLEH